VAAAPRIRGDAALDGMSYNFALHKMEYLLPIRVSSETNIRRMLCPRP
jgi:hypothetical protein